MNINNHTVNIAFFTLKNKYNFDGHLMNPESVSPLEGYIIGNFPKLNIKLHHIDSYFVDPQAYANQYFDIIGINVHVTDISEFRTILKNLPLNKMSKHVFIEGSYINCLKNGKNVIAKLLTENNINGYIVYGEIEPAVTGLIEHIIFDKPLNDVPNLLFKNNNWQGPHKIEYTDLSKIKKLPYQYLTELLDFPLHTFHVETSRGCAYGKCSFCTDTIIWGGGGWRGYPIENVVRIFRDLQDKKVDFLYLYDKDFWGYDFVRAEKLANALLKANISIPYFACLRADEIIKGKNIIPLYVKSGLSFIFLGAEAFSNSILKRYNKGIILEQTIEAIEILKSNNIEFNLGYFTDPLSSFSELQESLEVIKKHELWKYLSSIFNIITVRDGIGYETMLRKENLLGELHEDNLSFNYSYKDKLVEKIINYARSWVGSTMHLHRHLLIMMHMTVKTNRMEFHKYKNFLERLYKIDFDLFYDIVQLFYKNGSEGQLQKTSNDATNNYERTKQELILALDPSTSLNKYFFSEIKKQKKIY